MHAETPVIDKPDDKLSSWDVIQVVAEVHSPEVPASVVPQVNDSPVNEEELMEEDSDSSGEAAVMEEIFKSEHLEGDSSDEAVPSEDESIDVNANILKPGQLMTLTVNVGGRECVTLIDSGSTASLVKRSVVSGSTLTAVAATITGLGAASVPVIGESIIPIKLGPLQLAVTCSAVPDADIGYDIILGENFLVEYGVIIDYANSKISGRYNGGQFDVFTRDISSVIIRNVPVYLSSEHLVQSGEAELVAINVARTETAKLTLHDIENVLFEPCEDALPDLVYPECGIVNISDGSTSILLNSTRDGGKKVYVKKGTLVGRLSSIVEVDIEVNASSATPDDRSKRVDLLELEGLTEDQASLVRNCLKTTNRLQTPSNL